MLEVDIPIAPQIEQGTINVNIQTISQYSHQDLQVELKILVIKVFNLHINCMNSVIGNSLKVQQSTDTPRCCWI